jgi:ABC-2 type transport system ATP-binding protein
MIVRTEGLAKTFEVGFRRRRVEAVRDLTLQVSEGEIFGFVGPNGAGKTTTIKMLMGLIHPTAGRAFVFDAPIPSREAKSRIGYLPEHPAFYDFLTGLEAMDLFARLAGVPRPERRGRIDELLALVGLAGAENRQIRKYSKGMQQRLGLAQALVADPAFVVLDEPMSGLDPVGRKDVRDLILELKRRGKTVFFSTHILPDVETLCDRVGLIHRGRLAAAGRIQDLVSARLKSIEVTASAPEPARAALGRGRALSRAGDEVTVAFEDDAAAEAAIRAVVGAGGRILSVVRHRETLEDFFMRTLEDDGAEPAALRRAS